MQKIFGKINNPFSFLNPNSQYANPVGPDFGLILFLNNLLKLIIVVAGLFSLFQFLTAGFQFINAGGDPKAINQAWNKIWQAILGLTVVAGSFVLAAIFGYLILGDPTAILNPKLYGPGP